MISREPAVRTGGAVDEAAARLLKIIESAYESVALLQREVDETAEGKDSRSHRPLGHAGCKLDRLRFHLTTSQRRLGELRSLRGFLLENEIERDDERSGQRQAA